VHRSSNRRSRLTLECGHDLVHNEDTFPRPADIHVQGEIIWQQAGYAGRSPVTGAEGDDHAPSGAIHIGVLLARHGDVDAACSVFRQVIDSGDPDQAPRAALLLGQLLGRQGDLPGARAAYLSAIEYGPPAAARAAFRLGLLLEEHGERLGAHGAYLLAMETADSEVAPRAAFHLT